MMIESNMKRLPDAFSHNAFFNKEIVFSSRQKSPLIHEQVVFTHNPHITVLLRL